MPDWTKVQRTAAPVAAPVLEPDAVLPPEDEGINPAALAGGVAVGAGALYGLSKLRNTPGVLGKVGKVASVGNAIRQQLMLSGFAPLKSLLGNVGTGVEQAAEGKGFRALKEILSPQTVREAVQSIRSGSGQVANPAGSSDVVNLPGWLSAPGRVMGGFDEATQAALRRAGTSAEEAQRATLQAPLAGTIAEAFESPVARYLHPFRRTPFNQFLEGLKRLPGGAEGTARAKALYGAAGAAHGAATSDEKYPLTLPLGVAASGRYGLPYAAAAFLGRSLAGGKGGGGIAGSALPVSEYGFEQSLTDPFKPFTEPAALRAFERMSGR